MSFFTILSPTCLLSLELFEIHVLLRQVPILADFLQPFEEIRCLLSEIEMGGVLPYGYDPCVTHRCRVESLILRGSQVLEIAHPQLVMHVLSNTIDATKLSSLCLDGYDPNKFPGTTLSKYLREHAPQIEELAFNMRSEEPCGYCPATYDQDSESVPQL